MLGVAGSGDRPLPQNPSTCGAYNSRKLARLAERGRFCRRALIEEWVVTPMTAPGKLRGGAKNHCGARVFARLAISASAALMMRLRVRKNCGAGGGT